MPIPALTMPIFLKYTAWFWLCQLERINTQTNET